MEARSARGDLTPRMEAMFRRDRLWAFGFVIALWFVIGLVLLEVNPYIASDGIRIVCWIAAVVLLLFNTASITAMVRHYSHDKEHIYGLDIRHLDAGR
jgi:cytochrome c oxidase assembly factor CtaG